MNTKKRIVTFTASALAVVMASTIALSEPVQNASLGIAAKDETVQVEKKNAANEVVPEKDNDTVYDLVKSGSKEYAKELEAFKKQDNITDEKAPAAKVEVKEVKEIPEEIKDAKLGVDTPVAGVTEISLPDSKIQEALTSGEKIAVQTNDGVVYADPMAEGDGFKVVKHDDGIQEIVYVYTVAGKQYTKSMDLFYNPAENTFNGKDGHGLLYLGFDLDLNNMVFYSTINPWQRNFGFCELYDIAAPLIGCHYNTERFKFEYRGLDWMIQPWKGQYGITTGAEVGIYNKPKDRVSEFYDCVNDDDMIPMGFKLYKNRHDGNGWQLLFEREVQPHWWITGFKVGEVTAWRDLMADCTLVMKDQDMLNGFVGALNDKGLKRGQDYVINDLTVTYRFR